MRHRLTTLAALLVLAACNNQKTPEPAAAPARPAVETASGAASVPATPTPLLPKDQATTEKFGAPIAGTSTVALADVAKTPGAFKGKTIVTTGTVAAVCQERGCWMEIRDGANANVRMHGHSFFVPKTSSGKKARVEGTVVLVKDGKECDEMSATGAKLELDATGIELM